MQTFFNRLTVARAGTLLEDCQAQIESLCLEYRQLQRDLAEARKSATEFYGANRAILDAPEQPAANTAEKEAALRTALENARKEENALRLTLNRLSECQSRNPAQNRQVSGNRQGGAFHALSGRNADGV